MRAMPVVTVGNLPVTCGHVKSTTKPANNPPSIPSNQGAALVAPFRLGERIMKYVCTIILFVTMMVTVPVYAESLSGISDCNDVSRGANRILNLCWNEVNLLKSNQDETYKGLSLLCNRLLSDGKEMVNWCNQNINQCSRKHVSWSIKYTLATGTDWRANCPCEVGIDWRDLSYLPTCKKIEYDNRPLFKFQG